MVEQMMGRDFAPTLAISERLRPKPSDARLEPGLIGQQQSDDHAAENGEDRSANDRKKLAQPPGGQRDNQTEQQARSFLFDKVHIRTPLCFRFPLDYSTA